MKRVSLYLSLLMLVCIRANAQNQLVPQGFPKYVPTPAEEQARLKEFEQGMRKMSRDSRASSESSPSVSPEMEEIVQRIQQAEERAVKASVIARTIDIIATLGIFVALARIIANRGFGMRHQCSFKGSELQRKPILFGIATEMLYAVVAAPLLLFVIVPCYSVVFGQSLIAKAILQSLLFVSGLLGSLIAGAVVGRMSTKNIGGHAILSGAISIVGMLALLVYGKTVTVPFVGGLNLICTIPLLFIGANFANTPETGKTRADETNQLLVSHSVEK